MFLRALLRQLSGCARHLALGLRYPLLVHHCSGLLFAQAGLIVLMDFETVVDTHRPGSIITRDVGCVIPAAPRMSYAEAVRRYVEPIVDNDVHVKTALDESHFPPLVDYTDLPDLEDDVPETRMDFPEKAPVLGESIGNRLRFGTFDDDDFVSSSSISESEIISPSESLFPFGYIAFGDFGPIPLFEVKKIEIMEVDSDDDCPPTPRISAEEAVAVIESFPWITDFFTDENLLNCIPRRMVRLAKLRRKWRKRHLRRSLAREKYFDDLDLLDDAIRENKNLRSDLPEVQSGKFEHKPLVSRNILTLQARGITNSEITNLMRSKAFDRVLFSTKQVSRMFRDVLQIRSAIAKLQAARTEEQRRLEKVNQKRAIAVERAAKYGEVETQGLGAVLSMSLKACSTIAGIASMVSIAKSAKAVEKKTSSLLDMITVKFKEFVNHMASYGPVVKAVFVSMVVWFIWRQFPNPLVRAVTLSIIPFAFSGEIKTFLTEFFQKVETVDDQVEVQAGIATNTILPSMIATLILLAVGIRGKPTILNAAIEAVRKLPSLSKGIDALLDFGAKALEIVVNIVLRFLKRPEIKFRRRMDSQVDDAVKKAWALDAEMVKGHDSSLSLQMYTKCMECCGELTKLISMYHEDVKVRQELVQIRNIMVGHCNKLKTTMGNGTGFRPEPVSVLLESDPGKGKTMQIPILVATLLKESGIMPDLTKDTMKQAYFTRPANSTFFDGYYGQPCYYIDDTFQRKRAISDVSEFDDIMAFYGTVTTMLNMAECEKKGMFPFTSSLLLMTTNATSFKTIGADAFLIQPEALRRRIDFHYHMDVRKEYQIKSGKNKGQLDYDKYKAEKNALIQAGKTGRHVHPWHIWEMWETDFSDEKPTYKPGTGRCFSELVGEVIEAIRYKQLSHEENMDHLDLILQSGGDDIEDDMSQMPGLVQESNDGSIFHSIADKVLSSRVMPDSADDFVPCDEEGYILPAGVKPPGRYDLTIAEDVFDSCDKIGEDAIRKLCHSLLSKDTTDLDNDDLCELHEDMSDEDRDIIREPLRGSRYVTDFDLTAIKKAVEKRGPNIDFTEKEMRDAEHKFLPKIVPAFSCEVHVDGKTVVSRNHTKSQRLLIAEQKRAKLILRSLIVVFGALYFCTLYVSMKYFWIPAITGLVAGIKSFFSKDKPIEADFEVQSNGPQVVNPVYRPPLPVSQSGSPGGLWENIYNNTFKMLVYVSESKLHPFGQITFLGANVAVMPHHFIQNMKQMLDEGVITGKSLVLFSNCGPAHLGIKLTVESVLSYPFAERPEDDLHFINFKRGFRMMPKIIDKIMLARDVQSLGGRRVRLDSASVESNGKLLDNAQRVTFNSPSVSYHCSPLYSQDGRVFPRYYQYEANTRKGDCGAPLTLCDYRHYQNRCLMGLHVAGRTDGMAFAVPLTQEMCSGIYEKFKPREYEEATHTQSFWDPKIQITAIDKIPFVESGEIGNLKPLYTTSETVSNPVRSSLVKTFIGESEFFKEEITVMNEGREPPVLVPMKMGPHRGSDGEIIYPMEQALQPYTEDVYIPKDGVLRVGLHVGLKDFSNATIGFEGRVLTKEEAVLGIPEMGLKSITRGTSVGFPLCKVANNKTYYFGEDEKMLDVTTPEAIKLFEEIDGLIELLKSGKRPQFVCRDFLKDEVRKLGKGARLIAGTDLRYYILCRMFFGAIVGAACRTNLKSGMCLGMNPYADWADLFHKLMGPDKTGKNVWDGDFGGFDSSQMPQMLWECLYYINSWYKLRGATDEENMIREILFLDLVSSRHVVSYQGVAGTVVEWAKSLPSGHFLTAFINSMLNKGLIAAGYVSLTGRLDFSETSVSLVMGDDNTVSTSDECIDLFNQVTLSRFLFETFGMVYTAGRKGEELRPTVGIDDVIFLQRRFAKKDGCIVCPIRPESFLHSMYYVGTNDQAETRKIILDSVELAFEELSMHAESHWNLVAPKLAAIKMQYNEVPNRPIDTSADYLELVRSRVPTYV